MILKNSIAHDGKYDNLWVIGDIKLAHDPDFRIEKATKNGTVLYQGQDRVVDFIESCGQDFQKAIFYILDGHLRRGTEVLTCHQLAIQYCIYKGYFEQQDIDTEIQEYIDRLIDLPKDLQFGQRYEEIGIVFGFDIDEDTVLSKDRISAESMDFVKRKVYDRLIDRHIVPEYLRTRGDRLCGFNDFFAGLRGTVIDLIRHRIFKEI